ncbi:MAG: hypothetical protein A2528_02465 [Candidatus Staskawiczbacteria bacterium RIFOXYD2_FULL_37_9]|uniref:Uncharacterized protein n=1 Tax=Candidatus Staskawiczbacteria bacterium RIFOXYB1_FULL_37_44 TaxID=1802223 RepID=A0A1G2ITB3_9BACT|nr:MAG: hypothetical protein A2358_02140 [Candidatus Staskawiczbacteria bacterium RIFOXYB1_FULL_37_44]OGZ82790.1 MAG: hypothetical protein A2416_03120 [Candidatus Staskawiczbacteria bacterium RIFOXYC1_FULL_37_52]OGZ87308.1 MAG: hypothetical protein A2444_02280 [Candidatus Staskawiczbacteria bacterium RIFOXYC2_FULL_37_19]OGZ90561.1 MAG: hypothetical protein A2581_02580 [Candidatus Staskawiczbacteria bacterium RIFOXYD1_FULL_37_110]OGZ94322.1 MAG: hypothetical protein A2528_02465 [Candidatus Stask
MIKIINKLKKYKNMENNNIKPLTLNDLVKYNHEVLFPFMEKTLAMKKDLKKTATKDDLKKFSTKKDLEKFATKNDLTKLKNEVLASQGKILKKLNDISGNKPKEISELKTRVEHIEDRIDLLAKSN